MEGDAFLVVDVAVLSLIGLIFCPCALALEFLMPKARAMGFDTLIMGMRDADAIRAEFGIPENEIIMAVIALGYRAQEPSRPERRPFDDVVKIF